MIAGYKQIINTVVTVAITCVMLCATASAETTVGIIVPELRAPFNSIFDSVGNGVDEGLDRRAPRLMLSKNYNPQDIAAWLRNENVGAVITLGSLGRKASVHLPANIPIVQGALLSASKTVDQYPGVALTPDPNALFTMLNKLDVTRKKVIVVYNPAKNQWVVDLAKRQAVVNGVQLVERRATGIKQAAIIYNEILAGDYHSNTAVWLLQDRKVVDSKVVLPFILEKAWQKKIIVFSSALSHVKKGVLFSMYPDNKQHGKQLATMVQSEIAEQYFVSKEMYPSHGLKSAVNIRTAEHLGLDISRADLREFNVVFPVSN